MNSIASFLPFPSLPSLLAVSKSNKSNRSRSTLLLLLVSLLTTPTQVYGSSGSCNLPLEYREKFQDALDSLEERVDDDIVAKLNKIGLPPLQTSIVMSNVIDFKIQVFEELFGTPDIRNEWLDVPDEFLNLAARMEKNFLKALGHSSSYINCKVVDKRFSMDVGVVGSVLKLELASDILPEISFLPDSLPSLDLATPVFDISYEFHMPVTVDLNLKKFILGETTLEFAAEFSTALSKELPILSDGSISFDGSIGMNASFSYSSIHQWSSSGSYEATLEANTTDGTSTANLGLRAYDDDMLDDTARKFYLTFVGEYLGTCSVWPRLVESARGFTRRLSPT